MKGGLQESAPSLQHILVDGELYGSLRAIATPGHIPGHLAFLDERDGTLYAGDSLIAVGKLAVSGYAPWYFPLPNVGDLGQSPRSAERGKIADVPGGAILPAGTALYVAVV